MKKSYYFFKTVIVNGRQRLRPIEGQYDKYGKPLRTDLNARGDTSLREKYPTGTVFGSENIEFRELGTTEFYDAFKIYPVGVSINDLLNLDHCPPKEMQEAYDRLIGANNQQATQQTLFTDDNIREDKDEKPAKATLLEVMRADANLKAPTIDKDGFHVNDRDWYMLVRNIKSRRNTMMIGPTGTGKTELVMLACKRLGIECNVYDMGSMYDPVSGLLGVHRLVKGGVSVFDYAKFTQDIQKPGVILLDELSRAPVTTNNILFPCLDSRRMLPVEMAGGDDLRSIPVHPDCVFVATANIGAEYTGTMSLDRALVGRFLPLELDYLPVANETYLLTERCGINKEKSSNISHVAATIRSLYKKQEISCTVSTRETLAAAQLVADGWTAMEAMEMIFLPMFEGWGTEGERGVVAKIFMTR